jgi:hypothetical protein
LISAGCHILIHDSGGYLAAILPVKLTKIVNIKDRPMRLSDKSL